MSVINVLARRSLAVLIVGLSIFSQAPAWAANISFAWDPSPNPLVAGYQVLYGLASGEYCCSIDAGANTNVAVTGLTPGLTYYFALQAYDSAYDGSLLSPELSTNIPLDLVITSEPANQTAIAGANVIFHVAVNGTPPFTFQWYDGGTPVATGTKATLHLANVSAANAGSYSVVINNSEGSVTSSAVILSVIGPPVIVSPPVAQSVAVGASVSFLMVVGGAPPFTFQWYNNGMPVAAGTEATLHLANVSAANAGSYSVVINNSGGSVTSSAVILSVIDPPVIVIPPVAQNADIGASVSFLMIVSGTPPFTFQWFNNGMPVATGTKETLRLLNVTAANAGNYSVTIQNAAGAASSAPIALTIANAFVTEAGVYNGLFYQTNGTLPDITAQTAGLLANCVVGPNGVYSAEVYLGGFNYPLAGTLNATGNDSEVVSRAANNLSDLNVTLNLDMTGATQMMTGFVSNMDTGNPWTAPLEADLATSAQVVPVGYFIVNISPAPGTPQNSPQISALVVGQSTAGGIINLSGFLADGTQVSQTVPVAQDGTIPVYFSLYGGLGVAEGWINLAGVQPTGTMTWICPAETSILFPQGFTNIVTVD